MRGCPLKKGEMREDVVNDVDALALQHRLVDPVDDLLCRASWSPRAMRILFFGVSGRSAHAAAKCNTTSIIIGNYTTPAARVQLSLKSKGRSISVTRSQSQTVPVISATATGSEARLTIRTSLPVAPADCGCIMHSYRPQRGCVSVNAVSI